MRKILFAMLALMPCWAYAYPIDVTVTGKGLDITVDSALQNQATILHLTSHEDVEVRCDITFDAGVESRRRSAMLEPKGREVLRFSPQREVVRMRVRVECRRLEDAEGDGGEADE